MNPILAISVGICLCSVGHLVDSAPAPCLALPAPDGFKSGFLPRSELNSIDDHQDFSTADNFEIPFSGPLGIIEGAKRPLDLSDTANAVPVELPTEQLGAKEPLDLSQTGNAVPLSLPIDELGAKGPLDLSQTGNAVPLSLPTDELGAKGPLELSQTGNAVPVKLPIDELGAKGPLDLSQTGNAVPLSLPTDELGAKGPLDLSHTENAVPVKLPTDQLSHGGIDVGNLAKPPSYIPTDVDSILPIKNVADKDQILEGPAGEIAHSIPVLSPTKHLTHKGLTGFLHGPKHEVIQNVVRIPEQAH